MTAQEAIKELRYQENMRAEGEHYQVSNLVIFEAIEALEKQIPKKPVKDKYRHKCCPNCGWIVSYDEGWGEKFVPYCENCGQGIDWGVIKWQA